MWDQHQGTAQMALGSPVSPTSPSCHACHQVHEAAGAVPALLPSARRCLPGAPRTLPAVCFQFLLAAAPPRFLSIKKKRKSQASSQCAAPGGSALLCPTPVGWGCAGRGQWVPSMSLFACAPKAWWWWCHLRSAAAGLSWPFWGSGVRGVHGAGWDVAML